MQVVRNTQTETYLRVASLSIALYDFILTLPAEWRFYRSQSSILHLSVACMFFILIRYTSILVLTISNYGFFSTNFTPKSCQKYFWAAPIMKVVQTMVSQAILGVRTVNISRRTPWVKWFIVTLFTIITILEWFTNLLQRNPVIKNGNCTAGNNASHLSVWLFYVLSMLYDLVTLSISTVFLFNLNTRDKRFSRLLRIMIYDGLGYFVVLTASNILNIILYRTSDEALQSSGASLAYAVVWIMSQRILIRLQEMAAEFDKQVDSVIITRNLQSAKDVTKAIRSQFDSKSPILEIPHTPGSSEANKNADVELDVQVRVEQSVSVEYQSWNRDRDHHRKPSFTWDSRP